MAAERKGHWRVNCPYLSDTVELRQLMEQHQARLENGGWCFSIQADEKPEEEQEDRQEGCTMSEGLFESGI